VIRKKKRKEKEKKRKDVPNLCPYPEQNVLDGILRQFNARSL
jgi:hypothetical protein